MTSPPIPVLLTCGGGPGILAQVASLAASRRAGVRIILADANPAAGNLFLPEVDARYRIPLCSDPDFIPALIRLIEREGVRYLYSGLDEEMPVIARHRAALAAAGCGILLPPAEALERALDKRATHMALDGRVHTPPTWFLSDGGPPSDAWDRLEGKAVIKVTASRGGRHVYLPDDRESYDFHLARARRWHAEAGLDFLVQRRIDGDEFNVTTLHDPQGREIYAFSRRKFETREVKSSTIAAVVERRDDVIDMARAAVEGLGLASGFNNTEIIVGADDDRPYFIEVNGGRTAAQDMNVVASGVNLTDLMMDLIEGHPVVPLAHIPDGKAILKIRRDVVVDIADVMGVPAP